MEGSLMNWKRLLVLGWRTTLAYGGTKTSFLVSVGKSIEQKNLRSTHYREIKLGKLVLMINWAPIYCKTEAGS